MKSEQLYAISIVTGEIFKIHEDDLKTLYSYQIPLKSKIPSGCKKCYGRGHIGTDSKNGLYLICSCVKRYFMDGYNPKDLVIELPRATTSSNI